MWLRASQSQNHETHKKFDFSNCGSEFQLTTFYFRKLINEEHQNLYRENIPAQLTTLQGCSVSVRAL